MDLSNLRSNLNVTPTPEVNVEREKVEPLVKTPEEFDTANEKTFQTYSSGLENQKIIMRSGRIIYVRQHKYITDREDEIEFLDEEIKLGFPGLKKGAPVTSSELDPMKALEKKIRAKIMAEIAAGDSEVQKLTPASTQDLGELSGNSNSVASE